MKQAMQIGALAIGALALGWPALAPAQTCGPTQQTIGWSQPNKVPITSENAVRWPTDASIRIAYGGAWCPSADQIELLDETGAAIPAQVRIHTPFALVPNAPTPLTMIEVDPIPTLTERGDYRVVVRPPDPALVANREFTLEFRTRGGESDPFPDFEGIRDVALDGLPCGETGSFEPADNNNPACPIPNALRLVVTFQPLDRADTAYVIYRTSTTGLDMAGQPIEALIDETPIPLQYENGARDLFGTGVLDRPVRLTMPYYPLPRRDCFSVRALDEWGRERGDLNNEACVDLPLFDPLPDGCDPMTTPPFPEPSPFEASPPLPGQMCTNLGLEGADPERPIPPVGEEPDPEPDAGAQDGDVPDGDGGVGAEEGGSGGGGGSSGCHITTPGAATPTWPLALLTLLLLAPLRRRR